MIYRLFQRKPVFVVTLPTPPTQEEYEGIRNNLKEELGDDYKVVIVVDPHKVHLDTKILK